MAALLAWALFSAGSVVSTACPPFVTDTDAPPKDSAPPMVPDEYIVRFTRPLSSEDRAWLSRKGLTDTNIIPLDDERTYLFLHSDAILPVLKRRVQSRDDRAPSPLPAQCKRTPEAALRLCTFLDENKIQTDYVEPNYLWFPAAAPSDTNRFRQWALDTIKADSALERTLGKGKDKDIIIAVVDTGVVLDHVDIASQLWANPHEQARHPDGIDGPPTNGVIDDLHGANYPGVLIEECKTHSGSPKGHPCDNLGHGTSVASIAAAATGNNEGMAGVAPGAKIMAVKFLSTKTFNIPNCTDAVCGSSVDGVNAIDYAIDMKADIINLSWGGYADSEHVCEAVKRAWAQGILVVAAAGNHRNNNDNLKHRFFPASCELDNVISVQASTRHDCPWKSTNYGHVSVDIAAPGEAVYAARTRNDYIDENGTSMAAPHVSGALALVKSLAPGWDYKQLKAYVLDSAEWVDAFRNLSSTGRRLDLEQATAAPVNLVLPTAATIWRSGATEKVEWTSRFTSMACPRADLDLILVDDPASSILLAQDVDWLAAQATVGVPGNVSGMAQLRARCAGTQIAVLSGKFAVQ
jgi:hypothetical protein